MPRERKHSAWDHFYIIDKHKDPHPHVQCKYCIKEYKRAVPERMQDHLDKKCSEAPNDAKSHEQHHRNSHMSKKEISSLVFLLAKLLSVDRSSATQILKNMTEQNEARLHEEVNFHPNQELSDFSFVERPYTLTKPIMLSSPYDSITRNTFAPQEFSYEYDFETTQQFHSQLEYLSIDQQKLRDVNNRRNRSTSTKNFFNKRYM